MTHTWGKNCSASNQERSKVVLEPLCFLFLESKKVFCLRSFFVDFSRFAFYHLLASTMSNDLTGRSISPLPSTSLPLKKKQKLDQTKAFKINSRFNASDFDITIVSSE